MSIFGDLPPHLAAIAAGANPLFQQRPNPMTLADVLGNQQQPSALSTEPQTRPQLRGTMPTPMASPGMPPMVQQATGQPQTLADVVQQPRKGHKGLFPGKDIGTWMGILGDALMAYGGLQPTNMARRHQALQNKQEQEFEREKWAAQLAAEQAKRLAPRPEQVGNTIGMFDPSALTYNPIFTAPSPPEQYAAAIGAQPGTPEWIEAVKAHRMGAWSDPVLENKVELEGVRQGGRRELLQDRLAVTRRGQDLQHGDRQASIRQSDTNNRRSTAQSNTNNQRSTQASRDNNAATNQTRRDTSKIRPSVSEPVAVGPNGQKLVVRGGKWVDAATGRPVQ